MKIETDKGERNAVINGNKTKEINKRKGKKNGRKIIYIYIYIYIISRM